jgi:hypothetical protein
MSVRSPRYLPSVLFLLLGVAGACSFQVPDEKDVFSKATDVGGKNSGGSSGKAGGTSSNGGDDTSGGGTTATDVGGTAGTSGVTTTEGGTAGAGGASTAGTSNAGTAGATTGGAGATGGGTAGMSGGEVSGGTGGGVAGNTNGGTAGTATGGSAGSAGSGEGGTAGYAGTAGWLGAGGFVDPFSIGLVHHYEFDEASGTVAIDSANANTPGTLMGGAVRVSPAKFSKGIRIRNDKVTTDYVELGQGLLTGLSTATISIWVLDQSIDRKGARALDFGSGSGTNFFLAPHATEPATSGIGGQIAGASGGLTFLNLWSIGNYADAGWHLFTTTWSTEAIDFYVDGVLAASKATPSVLPSGITASPNLMGKTFNDTSPAMYAHFDDLRIWNRVLTAAEIQGLFEML